MGQKCFKQYNSIDFFIDTKIFSCNDNAFDCTCHMYVRACVLEDLPIFFYFNPFLFANERTEMKLKIYLSEAWICSEFGMLITDVERERVKEGAILQLVKLKT